MLDLSRLCLAAAESGQIGPHVHVLVTGGLGFLGHAVSLHLLASGHRVTVLSRRRSTERLAPGAELVTGDLRDRARLARLVGEGGFDGVCHLAALTSAGDSLTDPLTYFDVNAVGTFNLLKAFEQASEERPGISFVFASTNIVYGSRPEGALTEDLDTHPESPYATSKVAAEQLVAAQASIGAIGATTLRLFNLAGAAGGVGDLDPGRIVPNVFRAMTGQLPHVTLNGGGAAVRDFVHVMDAAEAFRLAVERTRPGEHRLLNIGSGHGTSMLEVVTTAQQVTGRTVDVRRLPPKPEPFRLTADINLARVMLDWEPRRSALAEILTDAWAAWPVPGR
ncbi:NAD-dependent epimerase/dehydratase family protein [Micromonospora pisi]|uniref:NAD-dependent epimerase/dehydratase family protein n=1 Tax=Micromonospora pisi TaxID=589240 RepID=UPI001FE5C923|nr:NAD-dependent epimerase/dehydratase family protein [Micromonospora pisi]